MNIAFISGINYPQYSARGTIAFTLASWILNNPTYAQHYKNVPQYRITDNMAAEQGQSIDPRKVLQAARNINADEIWASDKLYDDQTTITLTKQFITQKQLSSWNGTVVGVPQGKTFQQWIDCYQWMLDSKNIDVIALSKYSVPQCFKHFSCTTDVGVTRPHAVYYLERNGLLQKPLHLAGADHHLIQEITQLKDIRLVRSIDSNICFKMGVHNLSIKKATHEPTERLNHQINTLTKQQQTMIEQNINDVLEVAH